MLAKASYLSVHIICVCQHDKGYTHKTLNDLKLKVDSHDWLNILQLHDTNTTIIYFMKAF